MGITEDDLASALIEYHNMATEENECHIYPEAHYNYYGDRGVADLYVLKEDIHGETTGRVYELKSESAVRQATGANEIIRQFNKMREYFFKGSSHSVPDNLVFELCFTPTEYNLRHICDTLSIYRASVRGPYDEVGDGTYVIITTRLPDADNIFPVQFCRSRLTAMKWYKFFSYVSGMNKDIRDEFEEIFVEIDAEHFNKR